MRLKIVGSSRTVRLQDVVGVECAASERVRSESHGG